MKIVKFKNGTFGVRKFTLLGWMYALNKSGEWGFRSDKLVQEFDYEYAVEVLEDMKNRSVTRSDFGKAV